MSAFGVKANTSPHAIKSPSWLLSSGMIGVYVGLYSSAELPVTAELYLSGRYV